MIITKEKKDGDNFETHEISPIEAVNKLVHQDDTLCKLLYQDNTFKR